MEKEIFKLLETKDYEGAANKANRLSPQALADFISTLDDTHLTPLSRALDSDLLAEVLLLLDTAL
ncbi:MAG: hypothetical protein IJP17_04815, partial [Clostridia bacterium]|nr:hypothetical protein [Clostridia bacterium]